MLVLRTPSQTMSATHGMLPPMLTYRLRLALFASDMLLPKSPPVAWRLTQHRGINCCSRHRRFTCMKTQCSGVNKSAVISAASSLIP